jgi:glycosyltransferase involved in cell wall biosynthesis
MQSFERQVMQRADLVIGVSERDCVYLEEFYGAKRTVVIPTGTDVEFFDYHPPGNEKRIVFCGSMDWMANIEGIEWFMQEVWPLIVDAEPDASMRVVGRSPAASLVKQAERWGDAWSFTGWVDDVREHVRGASAFVIPLRVAGGTRLKVFEAMAMGVPVVSTSIGVEGLPLEEGQHYLGGDSARELADALLRALRDSELGSNLSHAGRDYVEREASFQRAADVFEAACLSVLPG